MVNREKQNLHFKLVHFRRKTNRRTLEEICHKARNIESRRICRENAPDRLAAVNLRFCLI